MKHIRQMGMKATSLTRRSVLATGAAAGALAVAAPLKIASPAVAQSATLKVGILSPISGGMASLGTNKLNGIKMFFAEKDNKVAGRSIELVVEDDEPSRRRACARRASWWSRTKSTSCSASSAAPSATRSRNMWSGRRRFGSRPVRRRTAFSRRPTTALRLSRQPEHLAGERADGHVARRKGLQARFRHGLRLRHGTRGDGRVRPHLQAQGRQRVRAKSTRRSAPRISRRIWPRSSAPTPDLVYATYAGSDAVRFVQQFAAFGLKNSIRLAGYGYLVEEDVLEATRDAAEGVYSGINWAYGLDTPANKAFVAELPQAIQCSADGRFGRRLCRRAGGLGGLQQARRQGASQEALSNAILHARSTRRAVRSASIRKPATSIQNIYIREVVKDGDAFHNKVLATYPGRARPGRLTSATNALPASPGGSARSRRPTT